MTIAGIALKGLQEALGRAKLRAQFGAFISEQVAAHLVDSEQAYGQVGEIKTATVMILDIRGFSPLSEQFGPVRTFTALNEFFDPILPIVDDEGGHISVFTGDGFLAVFGVPADLEAHAQRALRCARRIVEATKQMRQTHDIVFEIGIGIHTGDLLPGIVGSHDRHTFTVIGTTVNLSSRLQELTKELGCAIVISESSIIAGAPSDGLFGPISLNIRGNKEPICVYHD